MDELIRSRMHEALDVEQPDSRLRSRVIASLPAAEPPTRRVWVPDAQWVVGAVAVLLTIALLAAVLYLQQGLIPARHGLVPQPKPVPALVSPEGIAVGPARRLSSAGGAGLRAVVHALRRLGGFGAQGSRSAHDMVTISSPNA